MKVMLKELQEAVPVFNKLLTKQIDFKTAYRLNKILKQVETDLKMIEDTRMEMIKKHKGVLKGNRFDFPEGAEVKLSDEFKEFLNTETEIPASQIPQEIMSKFEISASEVGLISKFIEEEVVEAVKK